MKSNPYVVLREAIQGHLADLTSPEKQKLIGLLAGDNVEDILPPRDADYAPVQIGFFDKGQGLAAAVGLVAIDKAGEEYAEFAMAYPQLKTGDCGDEIIKVSWVLWQKLRMRPHGTKVSWISTISELWESCGHDERVLSEACEDARLARKRGMTISSPRSLFGFARNRRAMLSEMGDDEEVIQL